MAQLIKFKLHGEVVEGKILANKGIAYQVELSDGSTLLAQKKHVTEGPYDAPIDPCSMLGTALATPSPLTDKTPRAENSEGSQDSPDPSIVTLKQLCFDLKIEPRIARRRLRKAQGLIGTGSRWEWEADSAALVEVKAILSAE